MMQVDFLDPNTVDDPLLKYAAIVSRYQGQWIYCQHKERESWEIPGGRREAGEDILVTAHRELHEETGAQAYQLSPVCTYSVTNGDIKTYGLLCYAEIESIGSLPDLEISRIQLCDTPPDLLTYPQIQPLLVEKVRQYLSEY